MKERSHDYRTAAPTVQQLSDVLDRAGKTIGGALNLVDEDPPGGAVCVASLRRGLYSRKNDRPGPCRPEAMTSRHAAAAPGREPTAIVEGEKP